MQELMTRYLESSVESFLRQQESLRAQIARMMNDAPLASMADLARQNGEIWSRMQESLLAAFKTTPPNGEGEK
jgi:polyhydroxyalkanoate synthesis regulator protein